jgi:hypothetical protein
VIPDVYNAFHSSAVCAAIVNVLYLNAMPDDPALAMVALGGQSVNRALKGVERVDLLPNVDLKAVFILVAAHFAFHRLPSVKVEPPTTDAVSSFGAHPRRL